MAIKLIALDLDGTLLTSDKKITTRTKDIIARAMSRGVTVTIATGRMLRSALYFARLLASDAPVVCCNGGYVGTAEGEPVFARYFDPALTAAFLTFAYERGWYVNWYRGMDIYASEYRPEYFTAYATTRGFVVREVGDDYLRYTEKVPQFVLRELTNGVDAYVCEVRERFGDQLIPQQNAGTSGRCAGSRGCDGVDPRRGHGRGRCGQRFRDAGDGGVLRRTRERAARGEGTRKLCDSIERCKRDCACH